MWPVRHERYFAALFGFEESDFAETRERFLSLCTFERSRGREQCRFCIPGSATTAAQTMSSGWHYTPSVSELRQEVTLALESFEARHPGYLAKVRAHFALHERPLGVDTSSVPFTSVGSLRLAHVLGVSSEQHLQYPGALFQAASQFNLLEFASPTLTPEDGIADYVFDATQGPDCAVACFAGTAYRNYLLHPEFTHDGALSDFPSLTGDAVCRKPRVPLTPDELNKKRGQRADYQIDMLQDVTQFITGMRGGREGHRDIPGIPYDSFYRIRNGYFRSSGEGMNGLTDRLSQLSAFFDISVPALLDRMSDLLRIGVVEDATVTCGILESETGSVPTPQTPFHTVWQTYNSALSLSGKRHDEAAAIPTLAKCVLNGSYEATLLAGVLRTLHHLEEVGTQSRDSVVSTKLPPIFLTKVGGGVFNNKASWILSAIERAMGRVSELDVPLDLRLVHYGRLDPKYLPSSPERRVL